MLPGHFGVGAMEESAIQVAEFVARVRAATGADHVDIVGHSQGGTVASHYLNSAVARNKVAGALRATHHGTWELGSPRWDGHRPTSG